MQITCPTCSARYELPDGAIPSAGRHVQCTACHARWFERPPARPVTQVLGEDEILARLEARRTRGGPLAAGTSAPADEDRLPWEDEEDAGSGAAEISQPTSDAPDEARTRQDAPPRLRLVQPAGSPASDARGEGQPGPDAGASAAGASTADAGLAGLDAVAGAQVARSAASDDGKGSEEPMDAPATEAGGREDPPSPPQAANREGRSRTHAEAAQTRPADAASPSNDQDSRHKGGPGDAPASMRLAPARTLPRGQLPLSPPPEDRPEEEPGSARGTGWAVALGLLVVLAALYFGSEPISAAVPALAPALEAFTSGIENAARAIREAVGAISG